ncbi:MAG TPA: ion channel [Candidatus Binataceae bacterium]|nr:ion channel [Candidatus Binataceae bacterium]
MASKIQTQVVPVTAGRTPRIAQIQNADGVFTDLYLYLVSCPWPLLLTLVAGVFFLSNAVFALAYLIDGGIENARRGSFADVYFFSVETMATIGYGRMAPVTFFAHLLMSVEALCGLLGFAVVTGLIFAKFSRPTARVRFSNYAVIARRDGVPSLMFRMVNVRANQIVEAQMHVVFARMERTIEGEAVRRFHDLELTRSRNAIFAFSWTAVHPIVPGSPLYGASPQSLKESTAWIVVSLTGLDETMSQTVHARMYYGDEHIRWGARLVDIMVRTPDGGFALDMSKFDDIEPVELPPWDIAAVGALTEL